MQGIVTKMKQYYPNVIIKYITLYVIIIFLQDWNLTSCIINVIIM